MKGNKLKELRKKTELSQKKHEELQKQAKQVIENRQNVDLKKLKKKRDEIDSKIKKMED
ncbi:unnamed protein product [Fructobacillus tropaeoli]|nr:unnamed protein product [Fructobacillus tropaeoli]